MRVVVLGIPGGLSRRDVAIVPNPRQVFRAHGENALAIERLKRTGSLLIADNGKLRTEY